VFKNGSFVGNKAIASVEVPAALAFGIGDTINARIVCDGDNVNTYLADENGDYVLIDERDMSEYGFDQGIIGVRTGGSEWGRVKSMLVYDPNNEEEILYRSAFEMGHNPFNRCTISDSMLSRTSGGAYGINAYGFDEYSLRVGILSSLYSSVIQISAACAILHEGSSPEKISIYGISGHR
jgi:hypothetical protein